MEPALSPGAGFHLTDTGQWETKVIPPEVIGRARPSGNLTIHGYLCTVFEDDTDMSQWAQKSDDAAVGGKISFDRVASRIASDSEDRGDANWIAPSWDDEAEEFGRVARDEGISIEQLQTAFAGGKLRMLSDSDWARLENTDSYDVNSRAEAVNIAGAYGRDAMSVLDAIDSGDPIPAPVVLERHDGSITLVAGNTRLMAARAAGRDDDPSGPVEVFWVRI